MAERCETCRFWLRFRPPAELAPGIADPDGLCRRYGVTKYHFCIGPNPFGPQGSPWPLVAHDQWCGEYKRARPGKNKG